MEAEADVGAAEAEGAVESILMERNPMKTALNTMNSFKLLTLAAFITGFTTLSAQDTPPATKDGVAPAGNKAAPAPKPVQQQFDSPQLAADALIKAADSYDVDALEKILGPGSEDLVTSKDPVLEKQRAAEFVKKAGEKQTIQIDPKNANKATLVVGNDDFPLAIPIVQQKKKWTFDTKSGRTEILLRRIGANELDAIEICHGYVDAQNAYAQEKHDDSIVNQYAQKIISTPGKHDGLVWKNDDGTLAGPISEGIADALSQGYTDRTQPYHGYYFKILKGQGSAAPLGKMDFVIEGAMIGGFGLVAAPAQYGVTGVKTFIVSNTGVVYQKDLGPDTLKAFQAMDVFNPDKTWQETDDEW